jgi:broad specificity phosphatase PhoE
MTLSKKDIELFMKYADVHTKKKAIKLLDRINKYKVDDIVGGSSVNVKHILWVRHCNSCSNARKASGIFGTQTYYSKKRQPLCTKLGILQSQALGGNLKKIINNFHSSHSSDLKIRYFSSYLPRAMLTAKLISSTCNIDSSKQSIVPLKYISEHTKVYNIGEQSQSRSKFKYIKKYMEKINDMFDGFNIDNTLLKIEKYNKDNDIVESGESDWIDFKKNILPKLESECINLIVSHGDYLKNHVLMELQHSPVLCDGSGKLIHPQNLQCYLIRYDNGSPTFIGTYINDGRKKIQQKPGTEKFIECKYTYRNNIGDKQ